MPFFSIILPTYNRASFINVAIESVIKQSFSDWELIIIDDGSSDNTSEVVTEYVLTDKRVKYFYQENQERCIARNNGMKIANGSYICFLDSDDYYLPDHLQQFYYTINETNQKEAFFISNCKLDTKGQINDVEMSKIEDYNHPIDFLFMNAISSPRVCLPASICEKYKFNPQFLIGEDTELWCKIAKENSVVVSEQATFVVVEHDSRSLNINKLITLESELKMINYLYNLYSNNILKRNYKIKKIGVYFKFVYLSKNKSISMYYLYLLKCFCTSPLFRIKEKVYLFFNYFS